MGYLISPIKKVKGFCRSGLDTKTVPKLSRRREIRLQSPDRRQFLTAQSPPPPPYRRFREQLDRVQPFSLIVQACAVGLVTGCGAIAFSELIHLVEWLALGSHDLPLHVVPELPWYRIVLVPTVGGLLLAPLLLLASREAGGHGVPEVIESVSLGSGKIRPRVALIKSFASALTIGTGGSVGREGPIVHIGASLGSASGRRLGTAGNCQGPGQTDTGHHQPRGSVGSLFGNIFTHGARIFAGGLT